MNTAAAHAGRPGGARSGFDAGAAAEAGVGVGLAAGVVARRGFTGAGAGVGAVLVSPAVRAAADWAPPSGAAARGGLRGAGPGPVVRGVPRGVAA